MAKEKGSKAALKNESNHTNINKNSQIPQRNPETPQMLAKSEGDSVLSKTNSNKVLQYHFHSALMFFKSYFQVDSESKGEAKEKGKAAKGDLVKGPLEDLGKAVSDLFSFVEEHN